MCIAYKVHNNLYINLTNRCSCACVFCLRQTMDKDDYFKDFKLDNFRFIVVNNFDAPNPLVWEFEKTQAVGMIELGNRKLRDPEVIGKELYGYLREKPTVPNNIRVVGTNSIEQWFSEH